MKNKPEVFQTGENPAILILKRRRDQVILPVNLQLMDDEGGFSPLKHRYASS